MSFLAALRPLQDAYSTPVDIFSIARITVGVAAFVAPSLVAARPLGPAKASPFPVRQTAVRDIALGLLLRSTSAQLVARVLQASVVADSLDVASAFFGYIGGTLTGGRALTLAAVSTASVFVQLWILDQ